MSFSFFFSFFININKACEMAKKYLIFFSAGKVELIISVSCTNLFLSYFLDFLEQSGEYVMLSSTFPVMERDMEKKKKKRCHAWSKTNAITTILNFIIIEDSSR